MTDTGLDIGRRVKARRIADAIRSLKGGAHEAQQFSEGEWVMAAKLSAQQTGRGYPKRGDTLARVRRDPRAGDRVPVTARRSTAGFGHSTAAARGLVLCC